jgi:hypothetical protein
MNECPKIRADIERRRRRKTKGYISSQTPIIRMYDLIEKMGRKKAKRSKKPSQE